MRTIDAKSIPKRTLLDTGVVIRGLGQRSEDLIAPACRQIFNAMIKSTEHRILIAAPTIAELVRGQNPTALPSTLNVVVVAFDRGAANVLGKKAPHSIVQVRQSRAPADYWRYDALIVACAISAKADAIIAADGGVRELAIEMGMPSTSVFQPDDLWSPQASLSFAPED